jgi:16S rRNA (cytosine1402-N4)-methyltransferase
MSHEPVMLQEILQALATQPDAYIFDGTFGGGGHTRAFLESGAAVKVCAMDCDPEAGPRAEALAESFPGRLQFELANYSTVEDLEAGPFTGALLDLGVSSFQLDTPERGFSFRFDGPTDMRMNPSVGLSATHFLERATEADLIHAIRDLGEEPQWRKIVTAIMQARGRKILQNTAHLTQLITDTIGDHLKGRRCRIHPATLTFQGIRMVVNAELEHLEKALPAIYNKLTPGGVFAILTFHSLEDRLVKRFFKRLAGQPEHRWDSTPQEQREKVADVLTKRPLEPSLEEVKRNPRSRSAKLRLVRKIHNLINL